MGVASLDERFEDRQREHLGEVKRGRALVGIPPKCVDVAVGHQLVFRLRDPPVQTEDPEAKPAIRARPGCQLTKEAADLLGRRRRQTGGAAVAVADDPHDLVEQRPARIELAMLLDGHCLA